MLEFAVQTIATKPANNLLGTAWFSVSRSQIFPRKIFLSVSVGVSITAKAQFSSAFTTNTSDTSSSPLRTLLKTTPPQMSALNKATNWDYSPKIGISSRSIPFRQCEPNEAWARAIPLPSSQHSPQWQTWTANCVIDERSELSNAHKSYIMLSSKLSGSQPGTSAAQESIH